MPARSLSGTIRKSLRNQLHPPARTYAPGDRALAPHRVRWCLCHSDGHAGEGCGAAGVLASRPACPRARARVCVRARAETWEEREGGEGGVCARVRG